MKNRLILLKHMLLASWHWNRMISIQESTGKSHDNLRVFHNGYARSMAIYNDSITALSDAGSYVRAVDLIHRNASNEQD